MFKKVVILTLVISFLIISISFAEKLDDTVQSQSVITENQLSNSQMKNVESMPKHPKIQDVLLRLIEASEEGSESAQEFIKSRSIQVKEQDKITVFIILDIGKSIQDIDTELLESYGVEIIKSVDNILKADVPIQMIEQIVENVKGVSFIKLPDKPVPMNYQSEGTVLTVASHYHSQGYDGSGVKIGVVDVGFAGLSNAVSSGELSETIIVYDCTGENCENVTSPWDLDETDNHGTAVAEIVHDMAPGAQLYLIKISDRLDLSDAVSLSKQTGINVINHSANWFAHNFFDGKCYTVNSVCSVNNAYTNNIFWINSSANHARRHYESTFTDINSNQIHDTLIKISASIGDIIALNLNWNAWPVTDQDYDLYLYDNSLNLVDSSMTLQTGTQPPLEAIYYFVTSSGDYYIGVRKAPASLSSRFKIFSHGRDLIPSVPSGSVVTPADAVNAFAVGAVDYPKWATGPIAHYSSQGPTTDGRTKPEIVAPAGVSTYSLGTNNFDGTSASAPHVAGAAALILSKHPAYSVSQLWEALKNSTVDVLCAGKDNQTGYGLLYLPAIDRAPTSMVTPACQQSFAYSPTLSPVVNTDPFQAKPLGLGSIVTGGSTLSPRISLSKILSPVDIYGAFVVSADPHHVNVLNADGVSFQTFTMDEILLALSTGIPPVGAQAWKSNSTGPIDVKLFDLPISELPPGIYFAYIVVTPAGSLSSYYLWETSFVVP